MNLHAQTHATSGMQTNAGCIALIVSKTALNNIKYAGVTGSGVTKWYTLIMF